MYPFPGSSQPEAADDSTRESLYHVQQKYDEKGWSYVIRTMPRGYGNLASLEEQDENSSR